MTNNWADLAKVVGVVLALIIGLFLAARYQSRVRDSNERHHFRVATSTCQLLHRPADDDCIAIVLDALREVDPE